MCELRTLYNLLKPAPDLLSEPRLPISATTALQRYRRLMLIPCAIVFTIVAGMCPLSAQATLGVRQLDNPPFSYNEHRQYIRINLRGLNLPQYADDDSRRRFFTSLLQGRETEFALTTIEITTHGQPAYVHVLYSIEKEGRSYNVTTLAGGPSAGYRLTDGFVFDQSLPVTITATQSEWKERDDILSSLVSTASGVAGAGTEVIGATVSSLFGAVSILFPPTSQVTTMSTTIAPSDLTGAHVIVTTNTSTSDLELFTLEFETLEGYFRDFHLTDGLSRAGLSDNMASWQEMIREADRQVENSGLLGLDAPLLAFADYVAALPLTRFDRAILTACAIKEWAPNAYRGTQFNGHSAQFTANRYLRLPTGNLEAIRHSACDMPQQIDCSTDECRSVADFLIKSARRSGRRSAASLYIDESMTLVMDGREIEVGVADYVEKFGIRRPAVFRKEAVVGGQWSFVFGLFTRIGARVRASGGWPGSGRDWLHSSRRFGVRRLCA